MKTSGERIKRLRLTNNVSQQELSADLGYKTYTTVSKWESDSSLPPGKELIKLANYFDVTTDYLLGLDVFPSEYIVNDNQVTIELDYINSDLSRYLFVHGSGEDLELMPKKKVPNYILSDTPDNYFVTKIRTDSMNRIINSGDHVVVLDCKKAPDHPLQTGDIIIAKIDGEYKIEHLRKTDSTIYLEPYSYLDGFDTIVLSKEEFKNLDIIGKVVYAFREFN